MMVLQAAPSIIPCWAAGLTFGVLQLLPTLSHRTACCYVPPILQVLLRRRIRRHYMIQVSCSTWSCPDYICLVLILMIATCHDYMSDSRMYQNALQVMWVLVFAHAKQHFQLLYLPLCLLM